MNRSNPLSVFAVCVLASSLGMLPAHAEPTDSWELGPAKQETDSAASPSAKASASRDILPRDEAPWNFPKHVLPSAILAGPQAGVQASRLRATTEYRDFIEPTPGRGAWTSPSWGAVVTVRWRNGFSLTASPCRETYGLATREDTVSFAGNPFPHTLSSRTELSYNLWPLLAGMGWSTRSQRVQAQAGPYIAYLERAESEWTVDGEGYANRPAVAYAESLSGWMLAFEYGYRLGNGEIVLGLETHRASNSAMDGLEGTIRPEAAQARLGFLWTVMKR